MSDETSRPRRAWGPEEEVQDALIPEEPPAEANSAPRRGTADGEDQPLNPFARPGSDEAAVPLDPEFDEAPELMIPAPVFPRSAGEFADSPSPAPRRSALSGTTPVEVEAEPAAARPSAQLPPWVAANKGALLKWALIGLVGALVVGLIAFFVSQNRGTTETPTDPVTPSSSVSTSPPPEPAEASDLVTGEDLAAIAPAADWSVVETSDSPTDLKLRPLCLSTTQPAHNPTHFFQQALGTQDPAKLSALHRISVYANEAAAGAVMAEVVAALSNCSEVPARIVRASTVDGLAQDAFQVTILQEEETPKYHTILLTRDGTALQLLVVARNGEPVDPAILPATLLRSQTRLAMAQGVPAPTTPETTLTVVPPADPVGWLAPIDLPRLHAGVGRWTMTSPQPIDTRGMGCENMELATESGPTERSKISYALTQDAGVPDRFGIDELKFTFPSPAEAAAFVTKLGANMHSCKERVNTAEVTELPGVSPMDADGNVLSARIFTASQAISDTEKVHYQILVGVAGDKVAYTLIPVTPEAQFTEPQLNELATRMVLRAGQGS